MSNVHTIKSLFGDTQTDKFVVNYGNALYNIYFHVHDDKVSMSVYEICNENNRTVNCFRVSKVVPALYLHLDIEALADNLLSNLIN
jgi:hypothetical protein